MNNFYGITSLDSLNMSIIEVLHFFNTKCKKDDTQLEGIFFIIQYSRRPPPKTLSYNNNNNHIIIITIIKNLVKFYKTIRNYSEIFGVSSSFIWNF